MCPVAQLNFWFLGILKKEWKVLHGCSFRNEYSPSEHPVTEEIFGVDLVALRFRIAQGYSFPCETLKSKGHSVEARIYLEDPKKNFLPTPGYIASFVPYQQRGIRWEVGLDKAVKFRAVLIQWLQS